MLGTIFFGLLGGIAGAVAVRIIFRVAFGPKSYEEEVRRVKADMLKRGMPLTDCDVIHRIPGALCPMGYELREGAFRRGSETWDACVRTGSWRWSSSRHGLSIDFLLAGENFDFDIEVHP